DTLWRTSDGGRTWSSASLGATVCQAGSISAISMLDDTHGWDVEDEPTGPVGALLATSNAGATWGSRSERLPVLGVVRFVTSQVGYLGGDPAVMNPGRLYRTTDGGRTWS